jgi:uncharacterized membrane protein YgcG
MTKRVIYSSIAAIWLLAALISFLPISMDLHRPMQESMMTLQLDDQLLDSTFDQDLAALSRESDVTMVNTSPDLMAQLDAYTVMKMANENEDIENNNNNNAKVMRNQPIFAVASSSHQCALDLTPTYAIVSSCISFYFPCLVMLAIYSRLYFYAKMHVKNIKAVTRPVILLGRFEPDPNESPGTTAEGQQPQAAQPLQKGKKKKRRHYQSPTPSGTCATSSTGGGNNHYHVSDHKAAVTLGIIMGVFLICWVPFFCVNIVAAFCKTCIPPIVFKILTWLGYSNSAFNPIIYSIFNLDFRLAFQKILTAKTRSYCCHRFPDIYEQGNSRSRGNSGQNGGAGYGGGAVGAQGSSNQLHPQLSMDFLRTNQQQQQCEQQQMVSNGNHQVHQQVNCQSTASNDNEDRHRLDPRRNTEHDDDDDDETSPTCTNVLVVSTSSGHIISSNNSMKTLHHHHIRRTSNSATQRQDSGQHLLSVAEKVV